MNESSSTPPPDRRVAVLLVDDQRLLREGLRTLLELHQDICVVGEAGDGLEATRRIIARWPEVQVLVLTTYDDDELVFRSIEAGASGYLLKDVGSDALADAVRAAGRGESPLQPSVARKILLKLRAGPAAPSQPLTVALEASPLTSRELEVLRLLGNRLALTDGTVKNYISSILAKTGLRDRTQAALFAVRHGLTGS